MPVFIDVSLSSKLESKYPISVDFIYLLDELDLKGKDLMEDGKSGEKRGTQFFCPKWSLSSPTSCSTAWARSPEGMKPLDWMMSLASWMISLANWMKILVTYPQKACSA